MIGNESVAALHDHHGEHHLAAIHRLTDEQARMVLAYLSGYNKKVFAEAMRHASVEVDR